MDVKLLKPETPEYKKFEEEVRKRTAEPPFNYVIPDDEDVSLAYSFILCNGAWIKLEDNLTYIVLYVHACNCKHKSQEEKSIETVETRGLCLNQLIE